MNRNTLFAIAFGIALLPAAGCSQKQQVTKTENQQQQASVTNVEPTAFKKLAESGKGIILDVRTPQETAGGTIENASTIDFYAPDFEEKIRLMDKTKEIYVYCKAGGRSAQAAELLIKNGFTKVYNLNGGIMAWQNQEYPVTAATAQSDEHIQVLSTAEFDKLLSANDLVLVDFHTLWCSPCRKMAPIVDAIEKEYEGKTKVLRVDIDQSTELAKNYEISGVPVFVIFKKGKEVWRKNGVMSKEELEAAIKAKL